MKPDLRSILRTPILLQNGVALVCAPKLFRFIFAIRSIINCIVVRVVTELLERNP